ncbi:TetR/AcrR family transcriptional regulator C-terminal domain-containing protein [Rhodococcus pyridinivorans]|uniref:TetR/AcrR family transcriptional regulator C-terminal domain-containing protein n=1 Tax=Rhodococcus pyridinivorans TaxID=103816 RepID=UPI001D156F52|nr:TetR/AcrR family transcriptional regulator C-terminal domain-containing protein [Rhodococcus pyridinivorans]WMM71779.1 TetR/AcrR family transcriptional regulator C-terminal domain-containing protein [Rhodococcus pyridinivorans]
MVRLPAGSYRAGAEYRFAPLTGDAPADVLDVAEQSRAIHRRHPWLSQVTASTLGPNSMRYLDHLVGALAPAGLDPTATMTGGALLSGWVTNFAAQEAAGMSAGAAGGGAAHIAAMLEHGDYPHLTALMTGASAGGSAGDVADADSRSGADDGSDANDRAFRAGIDALLFGIAPTR